MIGQLNEEAPTRKGEIGEPTAVCADPDACTDIVRMLFDECHETLLGFLAQRLPKDEEVADMAQEVYARLSSYEKNGTIRHPQAFLFTIAANLARDRLRLRQTRPPENQMPLEEDQLASPNVSPEEVVAFRQIGGLLKDALYELNPIHREALLLHRLDRLTHEQIARQFNLSVSSVRRYIDRSLNHCRTRLAEPSCKRHHRAAERPNAIAPF